MIGRFSHFVLLLALLATAACAVWGAETPSAEQQAAAPRSLVVLRNGEILSGRVSRDGERYLVASEGTEIRLPAREVDFVCQSLDEAYTMQHNRVVAGRIEDHLILADWCLRQQLLGYAAREITEAMEIDAKNPRVMLLDARLRRALLPEPPQATSADETTTAERPVSADELERLVRSLPPGTVETFTATVQPMLLNYCATAGCHGPSSTSSYTLLRAPLEKIAARRLTERNLYNTLRWIDRDNPIDSKLLSAAREPHGPNQASGATGVGTTKYQELASWVLQASPNSAANPAATVAASAAAVSLPAGAAPVLASPLPATVLVPNVPAPISRGMTGATPKLRKAPNATAAAASAKATAINAKTGAANPPASGAGVSAGAAPSSVEQQELAPQNTGDQR
jgi:hypothetical protein